MRMAKNLYHLFKGILRAVLFGALSSLWAAGSAWATYSIVACDDQTKECGVAVATHNLAVGSSVPFAEAGVGAGVSQFETNPLHKMAVLEALQMGRTAAQAIDAALKLDGSFEDGLGQQFRQIGVVSINGHAAAHTGTDAGGWAGHVTEPFVAAQGNGLASEDVLDAMLAAFRNMQGTLADRLVSALEAGRRAGGQTIGVKSAAVLVSSPDGWPIDVDLRVDASPTAVKDLRLLLNERLAFDLLIRARNAHRRGKPDEAAQHVEKALSLAPTWDRIWLRAARLAEAWGDEEVKTKRFCQFRQLNPVWAESLSDEFDFSVCDF